MAASSNPSYAKNNPLYHAAGGGNNSSGNSRRSHHHSDDAASNASRDSRASRSSKSRHAPTTVRSNLPPAGHAAARAAAAAAGGNHGHKSNHRRSRPDETPEHGRSGRDGGGRSESRGRTSSRDTGRGRRGLEDVDMASDFGDGGGDGSGSVVSGFSLMKETPQRHRSRSRSRSRGRGHRRSRSPTRGHLPRDGSRRDFDIEDGREDSGAAFLKDARGYGGGRVGGGSGTVGFAGGGGLSAAAAGRGLEPAVKGCGFMTTHTFLKLATFSVMLFYVVKLWTMHYDPSTGRLCSFSDKDMCVTSPASKILLTISRMSAGALFPSIMCCILSKCYATRYFLHHSWLALVVSFEPAHELHTYFGSLTLFFGVLHGIAHMARTIIEGHPDAMANKPMDRSGLAALLFIIPIACPMIMVRLKKTLTYEIRKALHLLFIPFTVAMCFHGKALRVTCSILLVWYLVDRLYFTTRMSFCIERPIMKPVGRGTFVRFDLPPGYQFKVGAYIQVNCPAISATEWHPFSIFPVPGSRPRAGFHAEAVGDWTQELFRLSLGDVCMPIWITAAQPSVLEKSIFFDNVMLVCTGAGITPAVSLADMFCKKKNVHLVWLSREAGMIAMFEKQLRRVKSTVHLTGNPSVKTKQRMIDLLAPSRGEVIATTAIASQSRSSSYADLAALGYGGGGGGDGVLNGGEAPMYRGELREEDEDDGDDRGGGAAAADDGWEDSGASSRHQRGGSTGSVGAGGGGGGKRSRRPRVPFGHPISINFGRPDMEKFIAETIQGTAVEGKWAPASGDVEAGGGGGGGGGSGSAAGKLRSSPPATEIGDGEDLSPTKLRTAMGRKVLQRLTTNQRITKRDLMSADLSVIAAAAKKESPPGSQRLDNTSANTPTGGEIGDGGRPVGDPRTWLVLYCGANAKVEKAVATACDDLGVTWRKEYFSACARASRRMRAFLSSGWVALFAAIVSRVVLSSHACSPDLQTPWVVNTSATAFDLGREVANCSGGVFNVEWIGHVEFPETIYVTDGTVLNIVGAGAGAVADGAANKRFLNVFNATVRVSGLRVQNCAAVTSGGAIWAEASVLNFNDTAWSGNVARDSGGAVAVFNSSGVSWGGQTALYNNSAFSGGAILVMGSSDVSWSGDMAWSNNSADYSGGAIFVMGSSDVSLGGDLTWFNNKAQFGGAVVIYNCSGVSWSGEATWSNNSADLSGGAVYVGDSSDVSWRGDTLWSNNTALDSGGAVYVQDSLDVLWSGTTTSSDNTAFGFGGAFFVQNGTHVSWSGETTWFGNTAVSSGGAIYVGDCSDVSWSGDTAWSYNTVDFNGGAIAVSDSSHVSWSGNTIWSYNRASEGAVSVSNSSHVSWSGTTTWFQNTADLNAGAIAVWDSSHVSWGGNTTWSYNTAFAFQGGAVVVDDSSNVSWSGETMWSRNTAGGDGGAVYVDNSSSVSWSGETTWSHNNAVKFGGGAVFVHESSHVSWSGETMWSHNAAGGDGGAVHVEDSSMVSWSGETTWFNNTASGSGGAAHVTGGHDVYWSGETTWSSNTAGLNGGAVHVFSSTVFMLNASLFEGNAADAGGAVMLSGVEIGPEFVLSNFTANTAPRGGAVYAVSSGIATDDFGFPDSPIVYNDCSFTGNRASLTGGAIESVAGNDHAVNTVFEENAAGVGGALRLGGSALLTNCTFLANSAEDEGPAISNLGVLGVEGNASRFSGNVFLCETGAYLHSADGDRYEAVCDGCPERVDGIEVENEDRVPICLEQLPHTRSEGGDSTIEALELDAGYWRTTNDSVYVLACYNEDACEGGMTDDPDFCREGYEGPYCSVCSGGYSMSLVFTCSKCVDDRGGIAILVVVALVVLGAAITLYVYLVSGEMSGACRGVIDRFTKGLPLQSFKIIVVVWQILTQFTSVANVTYPDAYQRFLEGVTVLNFDALWIPSAGCFVEVDFHRRLLVATIGPLVALGLLAITYAVAKRRNDGSTTALQRVGRKHVSMVLLISFLVYSSVSATVFQAFACEDLDDEKKYLRADYRIECDSPEHRAFQVYAGIMIFVYPVGIPLFYAYLLYNKRRVLRSEDKDKRAASPEVQPFHDLWAPYKPERYYYEVIECLRRTSLTGVVVFIFPNTAAQIAVTLMIAFSFVVISVLLAPYVCKWDAGLSLTGHIIVFSSMYTALLGRVDVSDERAPSQEVFAGVLVASHACMVVAVVVETAVIFWSMGRKEGPVPRDGPRHRVHCEGSFTPGKDAVLY
eukprot:g11167.t2